MICPGLVADDLSGFLNASKECSGLGDRDATRGTDGEVVGWAGAVSVGPAELCGGGGVSGDERAAVPAAARSLRGGGGGRSDRPAPRPGLGAAGTGGPDRVRGRAISDALLGFHGEAFPRGAGGRAGF